MSLNDKLYMLNNYLTVVEIAEEEKKETGIILSVTTKEKTVLKGRVVAASEYYTNSNGEQIKSSIKVGDTIVYQKWSATEFAFEDGKYILLKENDIVCTIKGGDK